MPLGEAVTVHPDGSMQAGRLDDPARISAIDAAAEIVASAQQRADEIVREATEQMGALRAQSQREGYERGLQEGVAAGRAEVAQTLALVQQAAQEGVTIRDRLITAAEAQIVDLVLEAADTVLRDAALIDPLVVVQVVRRALDRAGGQRVVRIRIHPEGVEIVRAALEERDGEGSRWEVIGDDAVDIGGCIVDTAKGQIDARLDVQLEALARALREAVPDAA